MRYATANIQALPFNKSFAEGIDAVMHQSDVIGWQEMIRPEFWRYLQNKKGWATIGGINKGTAISYRVSEFTLLREGNELLHHGTPAVCPERRIWWGMFSRIDYPRIKMIVTNRHYVSSAWNHKPDPQKALRKEMWLEGNKTDRALLFRLVETGIPLVNMADGNRMNYPIWSHMIRGQEVQYAGGKGIDYLGFINGKTRDWRLGTLYQIPIPGSDHHARIRPASLHNRVIP